VLIDVFKGAELDGLRLVVEHHRQQTRIIKRDFKNKRRY